MTKSTPGFQRPYIENGPIGSTPESGFDALSLAVHNRSRVGVSCHTTAPGNEMHEGRTPEEYSYILPLRRQKCIPLHTLHSVGAEWVFRMPHSPSRVFIVPTGSPRRIFLHRRDHGTVLRNNGRLTHLHGLHSALALTESPRSVYHHGLRVKPREEGRSRIKKKPTNGYEPPFH